MSANAAARVAAEFSIERTVRETERIYDDVLRRRGTDAHR